MKRAGTKETQTRFMSFLPQLSVLIALQLMLVVGVGSSLARETTLTVTAWGNLKVHRELAAEYSRLHPDVEVVFEEQPGGYWDSVVMNVAAGVGPDVYFTQEMLTVEMIENGVFLPLNEYMENDPDFSQDDLFPGLFDSFTWQGRIGAMPIVTFAAVLYYNKALFDEAGVLYPHSTTWDELPGIARKLTRADSSGAHTQFGFDHDRGSVNHTLFYYWQNGGGVLSQDGRQSLLNTEGSIGAAQFLYDLIWTHQVAPQPSQVGNFTFTAQNLAMFTQGSWHIDPFGELDGLDFGVATLPKGPVQDITTAYPNGYAISSVSRNPDVAWDYIKWVASPAGQKIIAESGLGIPVNRIVASSPAYLEGPTAEQRAVAAEALMNARAPWVIPGAESNIFNNLVSPQLWGIMDNRIPVGSAMGEAHRLTQQYLDEFWAKRDNK